MSSTHNGFSFLSQRSLVYALNVAKNPIQLCVLCASARAMIGIFLDRLRLFIVVPIEKVYPNLEVELDVSEQSENARIELATELFVPCADVDVHGVQSDAEPDIFEGAVLEQ